MTPELPHHARLTSTGDRLYLAVQMREYAKRVEAATREECAMVCDVTPPQPFRPSIEAAYAIRRMK